MQGNLFIINFFALNFCDPFSQLRDMTRGSLAPLYVLNIRILMCTQIKSLPLTFLPVLIFKANFRYFEMINVSKTKQTNFKLIQRQISLKQ